MQAAEDGFELFECLNEEELAAVGSLVETLGTYQASPHTGERMDKKTGTAGKARRAACSFSLPS